MSIGLKLKQQGNTSQISNTAKMGLMGTAIVGKVGAVSMGHANMPNNRRGVLGGQALISGSTSENSPGMKHRVAHEANGSTGSRPGERKNSSDVR